MKPWMYIIIGLGLAAIAYYLFMKYMPAKDRRGWCCTSTDRNGNCVDWRLSTLPCATPKSNVWN